MENRKARNSRKVKVKLDNRRFTWLEVEEDKLHIVVENNREVARNEKRELRHGSMYSLESLDRREGLYLTNESISMEEKIMEEETERERNQKLYKAIKQLTPRQQKMVNMIFFEGKSQDEAAERFGISKSAVSHALDRIYATLKTILKKYE